MQNNSGFPLILVWFIEYDNYYNYNNNNGIMLSETSVWNALIKKNFSSWSLICFSCWQMFWLLPMNNFFYGLQFSYRIWVFLLDFAISIWVIWTHFIYRHKLWWKICQIKKQTIALCWLIFEFFLIHLKSLISHCLVYNISLLLSAYCDSLHGVSNSTTV